MKMEDLKKIYEILDDQAKVLVGILLKRIEVLSEQNTFKPELYKALVKEHIYEQFRNLKKIIELQITIGRVEFKNRG